MSPKLLKQHRLPCKYLFYQCIFQFQRNAFNYPDSTIGFNARPFQESKGEYSQHIIMSIKENWIAMHT